VRLTSAHCESTVSKNPLDNSFATVVTREKRGNQKISIFFILPWRRLKGTINTLEVRTVSGASMNRKTSSLTNDIDTVVLSDEVIERTLGFSEAIRLVEAGFAADALGRARALPVVVELLDAIQVHFGIKSGYIKSSGVESSKSALIDYLSTEVGDVLGLKTGGYWLGNPAAGLPGHQAVMLLLNPGNGNVAAIMSANSITRLRTAAGGAVAAKYLAREDSRVVGVIGAGDQAHAQLEALRLCCPISKAYVWARRQEAAEAYASAWEDSGLNVEAVRDIRAATEKADIVITATASTRPLVNSEDIRPGTHISAVGSDGRGKQELEVRLLQRAKVVVDKARQSLTIGELQHALSEGLDAEKMIFAELGEICAGLKPGRETAEEITIFDSSGVSFQDLVVAGYLVRRARSEQFGERIVL
jgi:alanine dehydrogenase